MEYNFLSLSKSKAANITAIILILCQWMIPVILEASQNVLTLNQF